jgi:hypothetical protein
MVVLRKTLLAGGIDVHRIVTFFPRFIPEAAKFLEDYYVPVPLFSEHRGVPSPFYNEKDSSSILYYFDLVDT